MRPVTLYASLALAALGCRAGLRVEAFAPAQGPHGVRLQIQTGRETLAGELLEVRAAELLLLSEPRGGPKGTPAGLALVRYGSIESARVAQRPSLEIRNRKAPSSAARDQLRLLSRFPQGLAPELLARLLEQHAQTEPRQVP